MSSVFTKQQVFWLGDTLWNLYGDLRDRLFDANGLRLEQWRQQGRATLIKNGAGRTIYRVRLPDLDIFVKHFWTTTPINLLHQLIRQGRADKEFQLAHLLNEAGVSTIQPVALGERRRHGLLLESYLLTQAIPDGITLFELIERYVLTGQVPFGGRQRFHIAHELAGLAARIHEAGIEHRDLHEKNIVVQPIAGGKYRFFLLDLHELRIHRPLGWQRAIRELGRMGRYFTLRTTCADRYRFFKQYAILRGIPRHRIPSLAREVEAATLASRADFWRRRDARPQRKHPRISIYRTLSAVAYAVQDIPAQTIRALMRDPNAPFDPERGSVRRWWKIGRGTRVAEVELPQVRRGDTLIYKQYNFKGWLEAFAALFHRNQATRAWNSGSALLLRELPTPQPLVLIHKRKFGLPVTSYLVTERVPNAFTIDCYLDRHLPGLEPADQRRCVRGLLAAAARMLRKMHSRQVTHRDLKATNILVSHEGDIARPKLWLIDLDGVQTWMEVPQRSRIQNLTRFYVNFHNHRFISLTDRLRFLRIYLGRDFLERDIWKSLWRQILERTERKIARSIRQGRSRNESTR